MNHKMGIRGRLEGVMKGGEVWRTFQESIKIWNRLHTNKEEKHQGEIFFELVFGATQSHAHFQIERDKESIRIE